MTIRLLPLLLAAMAAAVLSTPVCAQAGFVVEYPEVQQASAARMRAGLMADGRLERLSGGLNGWIRMPRKVALRLVECPSSDIRWNAEEHAVELCYRMLTRLVGITAGQDSLLRQVSGAHFFMTLHGVAHGIVDELGVATGPDSEAAIDELTALLIIAGGGEDLAVYALRGITTLQRADPRWGELLPTAGQQRCRTAGARMLDVWSRRLGRYLR